MRFEGGRSSHERFHNQYGLLMADGHADGLRQALPGLRTFVLSRAGFAGIQRHAATWMGDNVSSWDHLWMSIPWRWASGLRAGVRRRGRGRLPRARRRGAVRALMQYGTLTPFCRNHSELGNVDQYAWSFGSTVLALAREAIRLRYRLMPYVATAFVRASESGAPVQRPLVFDHQHDPLVRDLDDEYLFGPDLLVAPVVAAGQTARQVYLPAGDWYDWHTDELVGGERHVVAATPMDRIPIYARGGAVVPMWPQAPPSTAGHHPTVLELHLFVPAADSAHASLLQEDDGLTDAALDGARRRTSFEVTRRGGRLTLRAEADGAGYPDFAREAFHLVVHGAAPASATLDGDPVDVAGGRVEIPNAGTGFTVELELAS
jgi:alpha-glucosidase